MARLSKRFNSYPCDDTESRTCRECAETKLITEFYVRFQPSTRRPSRDLLCARCRVARNVARRQSLHTREELLKLQSIYNARRPYSDPAKLTIMLRTKYGMTIDDKADLLAAQDGRCAICDVVLDPDVAQTLTSINIDHCHNSLFVRGLLCSPCNRGLGCFEDDPQRMERALDYLKSGGVPMAVERQWIPIRHQRKEPSCPPGA